MNFRNVSEGCVGHEDLRFDFWNAKTTSTTCNMDFLLLYVTFVVIIDSNYCLRLENHFV